MLNEEGRPCTYYSPWQKAQRILYRVSLTNVVGVGIFFGARYAASALETLSGYDPVTKEGGWGAWWLYWLALIMKGAIVATDVVYVIISNIFTTGSELFLQMWEVSEEIRVRWHKPTPSNPNRPHGTHCENDGPHTELESSAAE